MTHASTHMHVMVLGLRGFPDVQGGVERHAEHLYPLLAEAGCDVEVLVRSAYVPPERKIWNGVRLRRIWAPRLPGVEALIHSLIGVIYASFARPDLLHIHAVGPAIVTPLAKMLGLKVIVTHHGPDYDREKWGFIARGLLRLGEKWGMRYAYQRIAVSDVIRRLILEKYNLDSVVIPNGVTLPKIPDTSEALVRFALDAGHYILLVSRLVPEKRHLDLIDAFAQSGLTNWKLVLVGKIDRTNPYCMKLQSTAKQTSGIVMTGFQSGKTLHELYAHAGLFVLPSSHEGLPIALLEALSYGLPVLASDIPANLEIGLPSQHYYPLGDITALASALCSLAAKPITDVRRQEQRALVKQRYDWSLIASRTLEIYRLIAI